MHPYSPEGLYATPPGIDALRRGLGSQQIFRAMCVKCDEQHNLYVDLGDETGIIPREEAALGIREGTVKDYAILSRVGKPVSFLVTDFPGDGTVRLSRRAAQLDARSYYLNTLIPGDIVQGCVVSTAEFGLFCDLGSGFTALMPTCRCCVSRLRSSAERYVPGQRICAAVLEIQEELGRIVLTGREVLGTWEENIQGFRQGQTVPGIVRSKMPYGIFVELTPNLSGLAEPTDGVQVGDSVSVFLRAILPEKHKIKLNILEKLPAPLPPAEPEFFVTSGHLDSWRYSPGSSAVTYFR